MGFKIASLTVGSTFLLTWVYNVFFRLHWVSIDWWVFIPLLVGGMAVSWALWLMGGYQLITDKEMLEVDVYKALFDKSLENTTGIDVSYWEDKDLETKVAILNQLIEAQRKKEK